AGEAEGVSLADVRPIVPPESDDIDELGILGEQIGQGIGVRPVPGVFPAVDDRLGCLQHVLVPPVGTDSSTATRRTCTDILHNTPDFGAVAADCETAPWETRCAAPSSVRCRGTRYGAELVSTGDVAEGRNEVGQLPLPRSRRAVRREPGCGCFGKGEPEAIGS